MVTGSWKHRSAAQWQKEITFISHAECEDDAKLLADILMQRHGAEVTLITEIGPVIGSHAGPGTLAIFFIGKHR